MKDMFFCSIIDELHYPEKRVHFKNDFGHYHISEQSRVLYTYIHRCRVYAVNSPKMCPEGTISPGKGSCPPPHLPTAASFAIATRATAELKKGLTFCHSRFCYRHDIIRSPSYLISEFVAWSSWHTHCFYTVNWEKFVTPKLREW